MKLPAVAITAPFVCGIALGLCPLIARLATSHFWLVLMGGLRLSFSPGPENTPLPVLHAGDYVTVVAQAKRPQVFRDEGAFDRRAYLASHHGGRNSTTSDFLAAVRPRLGIISVGEGNSYGHPKRGPTGAA